MLINHILVADTFMYIHHPLQLSDRIPHGIMLVSWNKSLKRPKAFQSPL